MCYRPGAANDKVPAEQMNRDPLFVRIILIVLAFLVMAALIGLPLVGIGLALSGEKGPC